MTIKQQVLDDKWSVNVYAQAAEMELNVSYNLTVVATPLQSSKATNYPPSIR
jgi:hypothetical protein